MPKVISGLRERILAAARKRMLESSQHDFSTRQLADDCCIAAGTVYNYFRKKDEIVMEVMLEDWRECLLRMDRAVESATDLEDGLSRIEQILRDFSERFRPVWKGKALPFPEEEFHRDLIDSVKSPLSKLLTRLHYSPDPVEKRVLTEMVFTASLRKKGTLKEIIPVIRKILS